MEGRHCFGHLTVEENLLTGAFTRRDGRGPVRRDLDRVYGYFPKLKQRKDGLAGYISGGEQQMTALGRALMAQPKLILLDEPSMGLAPRLVDQIFSIIGDFKQRGLTVLLVEQNAHAALAIADRGYVIETGAINISGTGRALLGDERVRAAYLGL